MAFTIIVVVAVVMEDKAKVIPVLRGTTGTISELLGNASSTYLESMKSRCHKNTHIGHWTYTSRNY
jgi:hypothetical protein